MAKVLVVDDDRVAQAVIDSVLRAEGHDAVFAADGISAIAIARREAPDLIILDIGLPAGDGVTVLERLKNLQSLARLPVIVMTARGSEENRERALTAGADAFIEKSSDRDALAAAIRAALADTPIS